MSEKILSAEDREITEARKELNELTEIVNGCGIEVHRASGPGLLESTYELCLCRELTLPAISFERQKPAPVFYKGVKLDYGYRDHRWPTSLEIKSIEQTSAISDAQLLSYLKLSGMKVGLLMNFNVRMLTHRVQRFSDRQKKFHCSSVFSVISVVKSSA